MNLYVFRLSNSLISKPVLQLANKSWQTFFLMLLIPLLNKKRHFAKEDVNACEYFSSQKKISHKLPNLNVINKKCDNNEGQKDRVDKKSFPWYIFT